MSPEALPNEAHFDAVVHAETERQRCEQPSPDAAWPRPAYPAASVISPSDPSERALDAFAQVVANLGGAESSDRIVFAHTHQPLACVTSSVDSRTRYRPEPRLLELLADLNPLAGGAGLPSR